jgi:hypothetical protein
MKNIILPLIAIILLAMPSIAFSPTLNDAAWAEVTVHDLNILSSDADLVSNAAGTYNLVSIRKYCDLLAEDARTALRNSQEYAVSSELQNTKNYYELALSFWQAGAEKASRGCALTNPGLITEGTKLIQKGTEYIILVRREISVLLG